MNKYKKTLSIVFILIIIVIILFNKKSDSILQKKPIYISIPEYVYPNKNKDIEELVIAICSENVKWIDNYSNKYKLITVYNKCGKKIKFKSNNIKVIDTPNIGSCDYAFLSYIIERYDDLPSFVEFTKGSLEPKGTYNNCVPCYTNNLRVENLLNFNLKNPYSFSFNKNMDKKSNWVVSKYKNMKEWVKNNKYLNMNYYRQNECNIIYGGRFGATSEQIKKSPKELYISLRQQQKYQREEVDHFIERTWRAVLCKPKYTLVIVAIFKNESIAIREWLEHYIKQGVQHFYMIDNGSTDNWQYEIKGFPVTVFSNEEKYKQTDHYNNYFLETVKVSSEWVMVVDLDEFVYGRKNNNITSILSNYDNDVGEIRIRWKMFGSNGHIKQPKSIIDGFTKRKPLDSPDINVKSIIRTSCLIKFNIHSHSTTDCKIIFEPPEITENSLELSLIHLNHYAIQSKDFFFNVKITRGDVLNSVSNNIRNIDYFNNYDVNTILDDELSYITANKNKDKNINNIKNKTLCIIACHTDKKYKIKTLIHNIKYFKEISDDIIIINSNEFKNLNIENMIERIYYLSNITFMYTENTNLICHGKYMDAIDKTDMDEYSNIILTNDSFLIVNSLMPFKNLCNKDRELVGICDNYEIKYHLPDYLRCYNIEGLKKIYKYYKENIPKITDFQSCIIVYEVDSLKIFNNYSVLFKMDSTYKKNMHYDDFVLKDYLENKNYPIIKLKKLFGTQYKSNSLPLDFNEDEYKKLNTDLNNVDGKNHFLSYGIKEGRLYKQNQKLNIPDYLQAFYDKLIF